MKKLTMICMSALLMLAVSCKKDKKTEVENAGSGFRATVESHEGTGKTHLENLAVIWDSDDAILVKSYSCPDPRGFTTQESGDNVNFDADATLPTNFYAPPYTGYYPANKFSDDQLTLPATQQYVGDNTFANGANPMAATSNETLLPFMNICGVLKLQLYSTVACKVQSISITSNTGQQLWGMGTVGFDTHNKPTLSELTGGSNTLTLNCNGENMSVISFSPSTYFFVVPVGTLGTSFTVKVTDSNGKVWTKTANAPQNLIARSKITVMPELEVATHTPVVPNSVTVTASCIDCTYTVSGTVNVPSGPHNCEYGLVYSETDATPTIEEGASKLVVNTETFDGTKDFTADITRLTEDVKYYVRAYAMIDGTAYSSVWTVQTVTYSTPKDLPSSWTNGKNPHPFTVASGKQVNFSQGNLQYLAQGGSGGNASATAASGENVGGTWRFAEHQFDFIGADNENAAQNNDGWIDLFGWGTSGYNHGATCYQPWSTSQTNSDYYAYSTSTYTYNLYDESGMADWGKANSISNGGGSSWRTLTGGDSGEWYYLISSRSDAANLYGEGKVGNCTPGLIILPDDWSWTGDVAEFGPSAAEESRRWKPGKTAWSNVYSYSEWAKMEAAGAVFLPAAGYRYGPSVSKVGIYGYYCSSSRGYSESAYVLSFASGGVVPDGRSDRYVGVSVRLVSEN